MGVRYVTGSTGIVITVPECDDVVADVRTRYDPAVAYGVPPHVTVLFPWLPQPTVSPDELAALEHLAAATPAFEAALTRVGRFPGVAWLAPEPVAAFAALTRSVFARWPQTPPYEGRFAEPVPHLTVADGQPDEVIDAVAAELGGALPVRFQVDALTLLCFDGRRWTPLGSFPLAPHPGETKATQFSPKM